MYGEVWGEGRPRKYLANSYTAARVNVYYKLSSFFSNVILEVEQRY